jgi:heptosyltransferase II
VNPILIVAPNWLGDAVMALPAIADVQRADPARRITIAARPSIRWLFSLAEPHYAHVGVVAGGHEAAILLPNSFRSALDVWRAGIPERWGYRTDWRGPLLTRAVPPLRERCHQIAYYQHLVRALGFPNGPGEPRLVATDAMRTEGAEALERAAWDRRSPVVAFAPGAAYGGAKRWPPEYYAELALALDGDGISVALLGSAADAPTGQEIEAHLARSRRHVRTLNLIGKTDLPTLAGVLVMSRALVTNDSGAMHLAAALGVRVTAVFGPTNERETGPHGSVLLKAESADTTYGHAVLTSDVPCRPCMLRECPIDHRCMRGVGVDRVLAEARRTL